MIWLIAGWFVRGVALGIIPVLVNWVLTYLLKQPANFATLLGRGELLLLSFGLILGAMGDIIAVRPGWDKAKGAACGFSGAMILAIGVVYIPSTRPTLLADPVSASRVGMLSLGIYVFALVISFAILYAGKEGSDVQSNSDNGTGS